MSSAKFANPGEPFGHAFGRLVKLKRGVEGLTQQALAVLAFGEESAKARISELENGRVANPHQKIVDALTVALSLTAEEVDACRPPPTPTPSPALLQELRLSETLLGKLAWDFGHDNPRASVGEYEAFLRAKAEELRALQSRIEAMGAAEGRIANLMGAAGAALKAGDFSEADRLLADAEEIQQTEHTLVQVRKQADIRETRGDAALLNNDADTAFEHYAAAAAMFDPFDAMEGAARRNRLEDRLYQHGSRYGGSGLRWSENLLLINLDIYREADTPTEWASAQHSLAITLSIQGRRTGGEDGMRLLSRAVEANEAALRIFTDKADPLYWAMTQINLANVLQNQGERAADAAGMQLLSRAVGAYEAVKQVYTEDAHPVPWAGTQNNLAAALLNMGARTGGEMGMHFLSRAVEACEAALHIRTEDAYPLEWAATQNNLATILQAQDDIAGGEGVVRLLANAVEAYEAALSVRTERAHPVNWAMTQSNLAIALASQGERVGGEAGMRLLSRAAEAWKATLRVRTERAHPVDWAATQVNIGIASTVMAKTVPGEAVARLREAVAAFDRALTVYDPEAMSYRYEAATEARAEAAAALAALNPAE